MDCDFTYNEGEETGDSHAEELITVREQPVSQAVTDKSGTGPEENAEIDERALFESIERPVSARRPDGAANPPPCIEPLSVAVKKPEETEAAETEIYTQGYLKAQILKNVNIFSLIGNELKEHKGTLKKVGANFLVLEENGAEQLLCDLSSIKIVRIVK